MVWARYVVLLALFLVSLGSGLNSKDWLLGSAKVSEFFQDEGGAPLYNFSKFLSSVCTFWVMPLVILFNHTSNNSRRAFFEFVRYFGAVLLGVVFKLAFYQGRPYMVYNRIHGDTCDPGMPSGHAIMATSGYVMAYSILSQQSTFNPKLHPLRNTMLAIACGVLAALIVWSRCVLGAHSLDQLVIGVLISLNIVLWFDEPAFEKCYHILEKHGVAIGSYLAIGIFVFGGVFLHLNHEYREDRVFWKYIDSNPLCKGTMVVSQSMNLSLCQILPGAIVFYPYGHKRKQHAHHDSFTIYMAPFKRFMVFVALVGLIPLVFGLTILYMCTQVLVNIYPISWFLLITAGLLAFYVGTVMSYYNEVVYARLGLTQIKEAIANLIHKDGTANEGEEVDNDLSKLSYGTLANPLGRTISQETTSEHPI